jgi:hypothetical protein
VSYRGPDVTGGDETSQRCGPELNVPGHAGDGLLTGAEGSPRVALGGDWWLWRAAALRSAGFPFGWLGSLAASPSCTEEEAAAVARRATVGLIRSGPFCAALAWQNPSLMENWAGAFAAAARTQADPPLHRRGQREAKLAHYAQRYCAKNDTIGFFGPVGWARMDEDVPGIEVRGSLGEAARSAHLETWAVAALARGWARDERLRPGQPVRLNPAATFEGTWLTMPLRRPADPGPLARALLASLEEGITVAKVVSAAARRLGRDEEAELAAELSRLADDGVVHIGYRVPIGEWPERSLARQIGTAARPQDRALMQHQLAQLAVTRDRAERARDAPEITTALIEAEQLLGELAGPQPSRARLPGRTPVYLDARRDIDVRIGSEALARLAAPLGLVLDSARWFVGQVAQELRTGIHDRLRDLQARRPGRPVNLSDLLLACADLLAGAPGTGVDSVVDDLELRWAEILRPARTGHDLTVAELAPMVATLFPPTRSPWAAGRNQSPDVMLGYLDGRSRPPVWVLGELHVAFNGLENRVFHTQATDRAALAAASALDFPGGRILPLYPVDGADVSSRTYPPTAVHLPGRFTYWSYAADDGHPEGAAGIPGTAIAVCEEDGEVFGYPAGLGWRAPVLEFVGEFATGLAVNRFRIRPAAAFNPRIRIEDLVIARAAWRVPADALAPLCEPRGRCFAGLRQELAGRGVPRHAFYRTVKDPKPCYVDLGAPLLLRGLADAVRRVADSRHPYLDVTEMLPGPGELWLTGPDGDAYTSELRMVVSDAREAAPFMPRAGERPASGG